MQAKAIILAGGFGTRLRKCVENIPKPMAPVRGRPFLEYILDHLHKYNISDVVLSTGYLSSKISEYFGNSYRNINIKYSEEDMPMGTGGATKLSLNKLDSELVFIINGDTLFRADLGKMVSSHKERKAAITIALRHTDNCDRYGKITTDSDNRIINFSEKTPEGGPGWINGGIYLLNRSIFDNTAFPEVFSLEKDLFSVYTSELKIYGAKDNAYFIDIGTPEDYKRAEDEL